MTGKLVGAHLQAYNVTSLPELLWSEAALLFLCILHSYVVLGMETFGLGHSSQSDESALDLSVVDILKQIIGLKEVMWLQAVVCDRTDKIPDVFQLVPVLTGVVDLFHRTWLENINEFAQQNSILQTFHEAVPNPFAGHILNPQPKLLFLLGVILPCKLTLDLGRKSEGWAAPEMC